MNKEYTGNLFCCLLDNDYFSAEIKEILFRWFEKYPLTITTGKVFLSWLKIGYGREEIKKWLNNWLIKGNKCGEMKEIDEEIRKYLKKFK